jgi:hypothetical protein
MDWLLFMEFIAREVDMRTIERYGGGLPTAMDLWVLDKARREAQNEAARKQQSETKRKR